jgi:hypothetical protein
LVLMTNSKFYTWILSFYHHGISLVLVDYHFIQWTIIALTCTYLIPVLHAFLITYILYLLNQNAIEN